ncbi:hypothetical protein [Psychroflexus halocasei]|uniref:DUF4374 domain-containing protein n=1 Tax=Psychroflexus halocasei TaxID=908615 RepID=A0A1H4DT93_9FLAO|nr:hypothetical protein [Psychroflexus halocasei]SEA75857.1 hypothetical protein SAMN05421540_1151 [Psychroflexus halocasei]
MKINFLSSAKVTLMGAALLTGVLVGCSSDDDGGGMPNPPQGDQSFYNVVFGVSSEGNSGTYAQALENISEGSISFDGQGFEVPSVRTARIYGSPSGDFLYNLSYGGGMIYKYKVNGGSSYQQLAETNVQVAMGTAYPRWTVVSKDDALVHTVNTENQYDDNGEYTFTKSEAVFQRVGLDDMTLEENNVIELPTFEDNFHIWRTDNPTIKNGKAYYGVAMRQFNPATGENENPETYKATTMIVDYPSLDNVEFVQSENAQGSTYGYRTPVYHADEAGDIYHLSSKPSKLLKITNGDYDNAYTLDLAEALGMTEVGANGWFYVGNGIGYVPFYDATKGRDKEDAAWGVARIDIYNQTAVKLNLPENLWMWYYQSGVVGRDGKFYMAITPLGQQGNIYKFDPNSESPDAFEIGAELDNGADSFYLGVY